MKAPPRPLIADDAGTAAHVWWRNGRLYDVKGNTWTTNGTVPMVARSGKTPAGAGSFSDANYYSLGAGNDALDFAGDCTIVCVFLAPASVANQPVFFANGDGSAATGYFGHLNATGNLRFGYAPSLALATANAQVAGAVNVACIGYGGGQTRAKLNLGAMASSTVAHWAAATTVAAQLGRYTSATFAFGSTIYELWASSTAMTDALATSIANRVKSKAGITAW